MFEVQLISGIKKRNEKQLFTLQIDINDFHYSRVSSIKGDLTELYNLLLDLKREINRKVRKDNTQILDFTKDIEDKRTLKPILEEIYKYPYDEFNTYGKAVRDVCNLIENLEEITTDEILDLALEDLK